MKPETLCKKHGVELIARPNGHHQIKGKLLVNYYPDARSAYIAGTKAGRKGVDWHTAIQMSNEQPVAFGKKDSRSKKGYRKDRARLIKKGVTNCHWCNTPLTLDSSTLEHIIPLDLGGLDNDNNKTLACNKCNQERGNSMPELNK